MPTTCKLIAKTTLGSSASSIEFTSIPGTYTDLLILFSARDSVASAMNAGARLTFNGSSSGYSWRNLRGSGTFVGSNVSGGEGWIRCGQQPGANATSNTFSNDSIYIPNYAGSANKSISADGVGENNSSANDGNNIIATAGLWSNTAAITTVNIQSNSASWVSGSSFFLYGITKSA